LSIHVVIEAEHGGLVQKQPEQGNIRARGLRPCEAPVRSGGQPLIYPAASCCRPPASCCLHAPSTGPSSRRRCWTCRHPSTCSLLPCRPLPCCRHHRPW